MNAQTLLLLFVVVAGSAVPAFAQRASPAREALIIALDALPRRLEPVIAALPPELRDGAASRLAENSRRHLGREIGLAEWAGLYDQAVDRAVALARQPWPDAKEAAAVRETLAWLTHPFVEARGNLAIKSGRQAAKP